MPEKLINSASPAPVSYCQIVESLDREEALIVLKALGQNPTSIQAWLGQSYVINWELLLNAIHPRLVTRVFSLYSNPPIPSWFGSPAGTTKVPNSQPPYPLVTVDPSIANTAGDPCIHDPEKLVYGKCDVCYPSSGNSLDFPAIRKYIYGDGPINDVPKTITTGVSLDGGKTIAGTSVGRTAAGTCVPKGNMGEGT